MHIKFLARGTGSVQAAADYLIGALAAAVELTDQRTQRVSQTRRSSTPWLISVEPGGQGPLLMNTTPLRF